MDVKAIVRTRRPALLGEALIVLVLVFAYDRIREFATTVTLRP